MVGVCGAGQDAIVIDDVNQEFPQSRTLEGLVYQAEQSLLCCVSGPCQDDP